MSSASSVINFGCRLNAYEAEVMKGHAEAAGDNVIVVNTCAVTGEAVRQARQSIRKLKREHPQARIIVTGCAAQTEPQTFAAMPEVARVLGNAEKMAAQNFRFDNALPQVVVQDIMEVRTTTPHLLDGFAERARAFVEVQNGCDHRCTFCIIPYGRGNSRSVPAGLVVERIQRLVDSGIQEVVLSGVDITSYGHDLPATPTLGNLVQRILKLVPDLPRLRLSSIDSIEADPALVEAIVGADRLMPHLHLSLQAGDNMILKRMKRRHSREEAIDFVAQVKSQRPEIAIGADIIAGFPTETEEMFAQSLALVEECAIVYGHIFPYSARKGTPAARMPQIPMPQRKERAARLRAACHAQYQRHLHARIGSMADCLIERADGLGHDADFSPILVPGAAIGQRIKARVIAVADDKLIGQIP